MAKHFAPSEKKNSLFARLRFPELPRLILRGEHTIRKKNYERPFSTREMLLLLGATLLFILGLILPLPHWAVLCVFALAAVIAFAPALLRQLSRIFSRQWPDEDLLVLAGVVAAFCIGEETGGAIAAILYRLAQVLEAYTETRGAAAFDLLRDKLPEKALLEVGEDTMEIMPEAVEPGQIIRVPSGEIVPLDGVILSGISSIDLSPLTGRDELQTLGAGDEVYSGSVNCGAELRVRVTRSFAESIAPGLLHEVENSSRYETEPERLSNKIAAYWGPAVGVLALLLALIPSLISGDWARWIRCAVIFLLLASPSALILSLSLACLGAEMSGIRRGILSKGHDCFEILASVKTMVFGKTGTITEGRYTITGVYPNKVSQEDLLAVAAAAESYSHHPLAMLLKRAAGWTPEVAEGVLEVEETPGRGVSAFIEGRHVYVGNAALLEEHGTNYAVPSRSGAAIHVAVENRYWGHILISDKTRDGAFDALEALRSYGVKQLVMLTGDVLSASRPLASSLGFDLLRTELTTQGKLSAIDYLISGKGGGTSVGFVGDGINDAKMLERADVGIAIDALRAGSEADAADILLLDDQIAALPRAMHIARVLRRILWENLGVLLGVKAVLMILALAGVLPIGAAAFCSTFSAALALLNGLRAFGLES
jgi:Cd2+/Zn2+-exporting ATPase